MTDSESFQANSWRRTVLLLHKLYPKNPSPSLKGGGKAPTSIVSRLSEMRANLERVLQRTAKKLADARSATATFDGINLYAAMAVPPELQEEENREDGDAVALPTLQREDEEE